MDMALLVGCGEISKPAQMPTSIAASANKTRAITNQNEAARSEPLGKTLAAGRVNPTFGCGQLFTVNPGCELWCGCLCELPPVHVLAQNKIPRFLFIHALFGLLLTLVSVVFTGTRCA